jgi:hypothetical protein
VAILICALGPRGRRDQCQRRSENDLLHFQSLPFVLLSAGYSRGRIGMSKELAARESGHPKHNATKRLSCLAALVLDTEPSNPPAEVSLTRSGKVQRKSRGFGLAPSRFPTRV